jgi:hypothetical protein
MDSRALSAQHLKAGKDYLAALNMLGLHPMFLGWGREVDSGEWLLGMVTSIVEAGGPLALNKLLFQAYNAEATPREISPFIVRVYSPEIAPATFYTLAAYDLAAKDLKVSGPNLAETFVTNVTMTFLGVEYEMINAYFIPQRVKRTKYQAKLAEWQMFKRNVEKLAA